MALRDAFNRIWQGWIGDVYPQLQPLQKLPTGDARSYALDAYADFLSDLVFELPGEDTTPFRIPRDNIFTEQPPDPQQLVFPAIAFVPVRGRHDQFGLGPNMLVDSSFGVYAPNTALLPFGEYVETFTLEIWAPHGPVRTSILAGINAAMRRAERSQDLLLQLLDYFGVVARFAHDESEYIDDADVVRNRLRAHFYVQLIVPEVLLVDATTFKPRLTVDAG
jgi:hypothetical protein